MGMPVIVKYLLSWSNAALAPPRRQLTTLAPTLLTNRPHLHRTSGAWPMSLDLMRQRSGPASQSRYRQPRLRAGSVRSPRHRGHSAPSYGTRCTPCSPPEALSPTTLSARRRRLRQDPSPHTPAPGWYPAYAGLPVNKQCLHGCLPNLLAYSFCPSSQHYSK